ncbi:MAG: phosphotransferase family protein [Pseudomonadota bacterium]
MSDLDFEPELFGAWLHTQTGREATLRIEPMRGGGSCEMFHLHHTTPEEDEQFVIRRAPLAVVSDSAHNVVREYRVIQALSGNKVRVPEVLAVCEDTAIMGAPFYVMRHVDGEVIRRRLPQQYVDNPAIQPHIGEELVDALVELHNCRWRGTQLETLAKPERFLERQVERWMSQLALYRNRDMGAVDAVANWLDDHRPATGELTVMHGDYKIDNALYSRELPPRILALVDFEMTTVGDPLIDLAWAMIFWPEEGNLIAIAAPGAEGGMDETHCQRPDTLVARYADATGRDLGSFQWYQAFAAWKLGIVLEASYAKYLSGESKNPNHEFFGFVVDQLMERAARFAR